MKRSDITSEKADISENEKQKRAAY